MDLQPALLIPPDAKSQLLPANDFSVSDFVSFPLPNAALSSRANQPELGDFFLTNSARQITTDLTELSSILAPPTSLLSKLYEHAKKLGPESAAFQCLHLTCPWRLTVCPLWIISFGVHVEDLRPAKAKWQRANQALINRTKTTRKSTTESTDLIERVFDGLGAIYWSGHVMGFDNLEEIAHLSLYATKEWFTDVQMSQMLDILRYDVLLNGTILDDDVPEIWMMEHIKDAYRRRNIYATEPDKFPRAHAFGKVLETRSRNRLGFMGNLRNLHWVGIVLDVQREEIRCGDPFKTDPDEEIRSALLWWTSFHTGTTFTWGKLLMAHQQDGHNCGILSFNGIAHDFIPAKYPLISTHGNGPADAKLKFLLRIIDRHLEVSTVELRL
ncbi:hypothetical protein B0H19DRAFT_955927 [Mycena capillaripes]|nr:hypothetical protein B0H19DRAFT_955927 [Mycena capillaripes]